jgi:hypothetical protein
LRYEVLMATNMKISVVWDAATCDLIGCDRHFRGVDYRRHYPNDGSSKLMRNVTAQSVGYIISKSV